MSRPELRHVVLGSLSKLYFEHIRLLLSASLLQPYVAKFMSLGCLDSLETPQTFLAVMENQLMANQSVPILLKVSHFVCFRRQLS